MATTAKAENSNIGGAGERPRGRKRDRTGPPPTAIPAIPAIEVWDRNRMLPRLIPVGPDELADDSREGRLAILRRLTTALRGERVRGRAGHWSYSLDRHIGLVQASAAERRLLAAIDRPTVAVGRPVTPR